MKKFLLSVLLIITLLAGLYNLNTLSGYTGSPAKMKGICVHGEDIEKYGAKKVLTEIKSYGYNTVFLLIKNPQGEVYYNSSFMPVKVPVLKETLEEAHLLGLKLYVYFPLFMDRHYGELHKSERMVSSDGKTNPYYISLLSDKYFQYIKLFLGELLRYNIDGVVFDYIRFPNGNYDFSPYFESYAKSEGISFTYVKQVAYKTFVYPADWKTMFLFYGTDPQVTKWINLREQIIRNEAEILKEYIKNIDPNVRVGAFMVARGFEESTDIKKTHAYQMVNFSQNYSTFSNLDFEIPMVYLKSIDESAEYAVSAAKKLKDNGAKEVYIGVNPYNIPADETNKEIFYAYAFGDGAVLFRYPLFNMGKTEFKDTPEPDSEVNCTVETSTGVTKKIKVDTDEHSFIPDYADTVFVQEYYAFKKILLYIGKHTLYKNDLLGNDFFTSKMDTAPFIKDNRTFVPIRFVAENLGFSVQWDAAERKVTIEENGLTIVMKIGSKTIYENGIKKSMDTAPFIKDNRTFVPIRFVAENLGFSVQWDAAERKVTIEGLSRIDE